MRVYPGILCFLTRTFCRATLTSSLVQITGQTTLAESLFVPDRLHDLAHLHGVARWDFLKRERELIRSNPGTALKHRPKLLEHVCFFFDCVAVSQHAIECGSSSLLSPGK